MLLNRWNYDIKNNFFRHAALMLRKKVWPVSEGVENERTLFETNNKLQNTIRYKVGNGRDVKESEDF